MISVIIPVYNVEPYLTRCVKSVLRQSYRNLEIILVDDGSTDHSGILCDELAKSDPRIKVIHKENGGLSSARNAGLEISTGDYISFIDSDDYIALDMYRSMLDALADKPEHVIANVMFCHVDEHGKTRPSCVPHNEDCHITPEEYLKELLLHQGDVSVCTKLFPRAMVQTIRFQENKANEDLLYMLELIPQLDGICFLGLVGYYYFSRPGSLSSAYGRAVCDMVGNSRYAYHYVRQKYPDLESIAFRFMMYQHMAYLLLVPDQHAECDLYADSLALIRRKLFQTMLNPHLTWKQKMVLLALAFFPRKMARLYQRRHRR